jgi:threonine/homoserine/homoserine lactone efflux protein
MEWKLLAAGVATGLAMSMPVGAVNLLVIRTALRRGFKPAVFASLGAVVADLLMAGVVVLGIAAVQKFMSSYALALQILGGLLLVVIGVRAARQHVMAEALEGTGYAAKLGLTFWLCISNPALYFAYALVLGGIAHALAAQQPAVLLLALGVGFGSFAWWLFLSYVVSALGKRLSPRILDGINKWSGIFVAALGFVLLFEAWPVVTAWFAR